MTTARLELRNRIIGLLLRKKREAARKALPECAAALGISVSTLKAYEEGRKTISLPELEALAYVLSVPVAELWDVDEDAQPEDDRSLPLPQIISLRQRIVGALLRQARIEAGLSQKDLADAVSRPVSRIVAYEYGELPIPFVELEQLAERLQRPIEYFLDDSDGPLGEWRRRTVAWKRFCQLPKEVQDFVLRPSNIRYLEIAMRLAQMPAGELRAIAEGLLEITY